MHTAGMACYEGLKATHTRVGKQALGAGGSGSRVLMAVAPRPSLRQAGSRSRCMPAVECHKVAVLGAAGGIGQPLSLLMKMSGLTTELALYDIANTPGVAADLGHCNTPIKVRPDPGRTRCQGGARWRLAARLSRTLG